MLFMFPAEKVLYTYSVKPWIFHLLKNENVLWLICWALIAEMHLPFDFSLSSIKTTSSEEILDGSLNILFACLFSLWKQQGHLLFVHDIDQGHQLWKCWPVNQLAQTQAGLTILALNGLNFSKYLSEKQYKTILKQYVYFNI